MEIVQNITNITISLTVV